MLAVAQALAAKTGQTQVAVEAKQGRWFSVGQSQLYIARSHNVLSGFG